MGLLNHQTAINNNQCESGMQGWAHCLIVTTAEMKSAMINTNEMSIASYKVVSDIYSTTLHDDITPKE